MNLLKVGKVVFRWWKNRTLYVKNKDFLIIDFKSVMVPTFSIKSGLNPSKSEKKNHPIIKF